LTEFIEIAFRTAGISDWGHYLRTDKTLSRPADVYSVVGDNSKAKRLLNWYPTTTFEEIIVNMVMFDVQKLNHSDKSMYWRPGDHA
jgi:GDPmannose 4,6-dehydratase